MCYSGVFFSDFHCHRGASGMMDTARIGRVCWLYFMFYCGCTMSVTNYRLVVCYVVFCI